MTSQASFALIALLFAGCADDMDRPWSLGVSAPSEPIAHVRGGTFRLDLELDIPQLCDPAKVEVAIVNTPFPEGGSAPQTVSLPVSADAIDCSNHRGSVELKYPPGGTVDLIMNGPGVRRRTSVVLEEAELILELRDVPGAEGYTHEVVVSSGVDDGVVKLTLIGATFASDSTVERTLALFPSVGSDCKTPGARCVATARVRSESPSFSAMASLVGVSQLSQRKTFVPNGASDVLTISAEPNPVPANTTFVTITVHAKNASGADIVAPLRFETIPASTITPSVGTTTTSGEFTTLLVFPKDVPLLRIDVRSGDLRGALLLQRAQ